MPLSPEGPCLGQLRNRQGLQGSQRAQQFGARTSASETGSAPCWCHVPAVQLWPSLATSRRHRARISHWTHRSESPQGLARVMHLMKLWLLSV